MISASLLWKIGPFGVCFIFAFLSLLDSRATLAMIFVGLGNLFFLFGLLKAKR